MHQPINITRFGGMNSRNDPGQLVPDASISMRNMESARQSARKRRGYKKATTKPEWGRSVRIDGLNTGVLASKLPFNPSLWQDVVSSDTQLTFQIKVKPVALDQLQPSQIPGSLDYNGKHERPIDKPMARSSSPGTVANQNNDLTQVRTTEATGYESDDANLWVPAGKDGTGTPASYDNRYDSTADKKYPWLPGIDALSVAEAETVQPIMACAWGTGPLREFPARHFNQSQERWSEYLDGVGSPVPTNLSFTHPDANVNWEQAINYCYAPTMAATNGEYDAGDLYLYYVYSPATAEWHLMFLWEYSGPGAWTFGKSATGIEVQTTTTGTPTSIVVKSGVNPLTKLRRGDKIYSDGGGTELGVLSTAQDQLPITYDGGTGYYTLHFDAAIAADVTADDDLQAYVRSSEWDNGLNRMYVFVGWGDASNGTTDPNLAATAIDPTQEYTVTCKFTRGTGATASEMSIWLDDPGSSPTVTEYGKIGAHANSQPKPASSTAPLFGLDQLFGLQNSSTSNAEGFKGRTMYLGGLPKMSNQRGPFGYGCGASVNRGGTIGVTCPCPGDYSEFRIYSGNFDTEGAGRAFKSGSEFAPYDSRALKYNDGGDGEGGPWDYTTTPTADDFEGTVNIWPLNEESGDIFYPRYFYSGRHTNDKNLVAFGDELSVVSGTGVGGWEATNAVVSADNKTAPDSSLTGDKIVFAAGGTMKIALEKGLVAGETYTLKWWAKSDAAVAADRVTFSVDGASNIASSSPAIGATWEEYSLDVLPTTTEQTGSVDSNKVRVTITGAEIDTVYVWGVRLYHSPASKVPAYIPRRNTAFYRGVIDVDTYDEEFKPFEPISNGALMDSGVLPGSVGSMRFNGGSPAFTTSGAVLWRGGSSEVESDFSVSDSGILETFTTDKKSNIGKLVPPENFAWGCIYTVGTAPVLEPATAETSGDTFIIGGTATTAAGSGGVKPSVSSKEPGQGEVHTLMQLMSPNRKGTSFTPTNTLGTVEAYPLKKDDYGHTESWEDDYDHPDNIWEKSYAYTAVSDETINTVGKPGQKRLEMGRIDLVAHNINDAGPPSTSSIKRRYVIRSDFGYGATKDTFNVSTTHEWEADQVLQQGGNDRMFRPIIDTAGSGSYQNKPADRDDEYWNANKTSSSAGVADNSYCWITLCAKDGTLYTKPTDIEGRTFAVIASYSTDPDAADNVTDVGTQSLQVWDITDPADVFEVSPSTTNTAQKSAKSGLSFSPSALYGSEKILYCLGGKIVGTDSRWYMPSDNSRTGADVNAYPYGAYSQGQTQNMKVDINGVVASAGMVTNGAKGSMDMALTFAEPLSSTLAKTFLTEIASKSASWATGMPTEARAILGTNVLSAHMCEAVGAPMVVDAISNVNIGSSTYIPCQTPISGSIRYLVNHISTYYGGMGGVSATFGLMPDANTSGPMSGNRCDPYTYNKSINASMFPDRFFGIRSINTGRGQGLFGDDDFGFTNAYEKANTAPNKETLLAVAKHVGQGDMTDVLVVSKTNVYRYKSSGDGELVRLGALPRHFDNQYPVSRDAVGSDLILTNGAGIPTTIDRNGNVLSAQFIKPPSYGSPAIHARAWYTHSTASGNVLDPPTPPASEWPYVYKISLSTRFGTDKNTLLVSRHEADKGLRWAGEMPAMMPLPDSSAGTDPPEEGLLLGAPTEIVQWAFFFTYYSEELDIESAPGRTFFWSNVAPLEIPTSITQLGYTGDDRANNEWTGEPATSSSVLVMRGKNPSNLPDIIAEGISPVGQPKSYNLVVDNIPISENPKVSHIRCYRTTINGSVFFLEDEIAVQSGNTDKTGRTSMLVGAVTDSELTEPFNGGLGSFVPSGARFTASFQGRMFYAGFSWAPTRIYWSYAGMPTSVPFFYWIELGGSSPAPVTGLWADQDRLYVFKEEATYVANVREWDVRTISQISQGLPVDFTITNLDMGAVGDRAVTAVPEKGIVLAGDSSVFLMSGLQANRISSAIDGTSPDELNRGSAANAATETRMVYPWALDSAKRDYWRLVYYPPLRSLFVFGNPFQDAEFTPVLNVDFMDWSYYTDYNFDDCEVITRLGEDTQDLWGVKNSRLWKLNESYADGVDYSCSNLNTTSAVSGSTSLLTGNMASAPTDGETIHLDLAYASLPTAYSALLQTSATDPGETRGFDLFKDSFVTLETNDDPVKCERRRVKYAWGDSDDGKVNLVMDVSGEPLANTYDTNSKWYIGTIDSHWTSSFIKPGGGVFPVETLRLDILTSGVAETLGGNEFRGSTDVYFGYDTTWPTSITNTVSASSAMRHSMMGFRGRGTGFSMMLLSKGAYAPVEYLSGVVSTNVLERKAGL